MLNGGYHILDFDGVNISSVDGATIDGAYSSIEGTNKAILLSGVVIDNIDYKDAYIIPTTGDNAFTFSAYGKSFTVTSENKVTVE